MRKLQRLLFAVLSIAFACAPLFAQVKGKSPVKKTSLKANKYTAMNTKETTAATEPWKYMNSKERFIEIETDYGVMIAKLYDSTPLHRDNFIKLVEQKFYDSLLFHRVINQFMIQGGDPSSKNAADGAQLGNGSAAGGRIPAEFKSSLIHKKGALAAARDDNPEKASNNCQFYIVAGKSFLNKELDNIYNQRVKPSNPSFNYSKTQKEIYARIGGTPFLDQSYTVFGEVISGLDIIDKIANAPKDTFDRPLQNVRMKIKLLN